VIGVDRELLQMDPTRNPVDAAQTDRRVTGHQDDERGGKVLQCAGTREGPDAERLEQGVSRGLDVGQQRQLVGPHWADDPGPRSVAFHVATVDVVYGQAPKGSISA
jgi:hypothetical protein